jgi:hypothetical protein
MSAFVQPTAAFPPAQPDDPNSPVLFKDNISLVQTQITTVRSLAHEALNAMYVTATPPIAQHRSSFSEIFIISKGAYQPGSSPAHTAGASILFASPSIRTNVLLAVLLDNLAALRQSIHTLNELLYTTGVGSLPLLAPEANEPPTEEQLADQAKKAIETLFTLHTRMQETASVAASIMSAPEQAPRR